MKNFKDIEVLYVKKIFFFFFLLFLNIFQYQIVMKTQLSQIIKNIESSTNSDSSNEVYNINNNNNRNIIVNKK